MLMMAKMGSSAQLLLLVCALIIGTRLSKACTFEGTLVTESNWYGYLANVTFRNSTINGFSFNFSYPSSYSTETVILYFDDQISNVSRESTCIKKKSVASEQNNQLIELSTGQLWSGCSQYNLSNTDGTMDVWIQCKSSRSFRTVRPRKWYIAVSNCDRSKGLWLQYSLNFTGAVECGQSEVSEADTVNRVTAISMILSGLIMLLLL